MYGVLRILFCACFSFLVNIEQSVERVSIASVILQGPILTVPPPGTRLLPP